MKVFRFLLLWLLLVSSAALAQKRVNFNIDTKQNRKNISPLIYGTNDNYIYAKAKRLGGNRITTYNWENNASNAGRDYIHNSDDYVPWQQGTPEADYNKPGAALKTFHQTSLNQNAYSLITLPLAKYVAADKNGPVTPAQIAPSSRWTEIVYKKPTPFSLTPNLTDGKVYTDEEVNFLINSFGKSNTATGVKAYALDNEPGIWFDTHSRLWGPEHTSVKFLMDRSFELSNRVKEMDPTAEIYGPASWGVAEFENLQFAPDWDQMNQGVYPNFLAYYLAKMKAKGQEAAINKRLLDVLDLHWYPQDRNDGLSPFGNSTDYATNAARMEMTRSLWDPTYVENTWVGNDPEKRNQFLPFIPKMHALIDTYYPGTKLGLSEYSYMGINHPSGGIAQADALGIFGKQGLYFATYWGGVDGYIKSAFDAYLNYDGKGGQFGNISIKSETSDVVNSSVHASVESANEKRTHLIAMNKNQDEPIIATIKVNSDYVFKSAQVWAFDNKSTTMRQLKNVRVINNNEFEYTIPPLTVCHILLTQEDLSVYPEFETSKVTPAAGYSDGTASFDIETVLSDGDNNITKVTADLSAVGGANNVPLIRSGTTMLYTLHYNLPVGTPSGLKDIKLSAVDASGKTAEATVNYRVIKKTTSTVIWDGDVITKGKGDIYYDGNDATAFGAKIEKRTTGGNTAPGSLFMHFIHDQSMYNFIAFRISNNDHPDDARDISDYGYLEFYIKSNAPATSDIEFSLRDASGQLNVSTPVFLKAGGYVSSFNPNGYTKVKIPIEDLTAGSEIDLTKIWQFNFSVNTASKGFDVWIDDIKGLPYSHPYKEPVISNLNLSKLAGYADGISQLTVSADIADPDGDLKNVTVDLSEFGGSNNQPMVNTNGKYSYTFTVPSGLQHGTKRIIITATDNTENATDAKINYKILEIANTLVLWDGDTKNTGQNIETNKNTVATVQPTGGNKGPISMRMHMDEMGDGFAAATWDWNAGTNDTQIKDLSDKRYLYFALKVTPPSSNFDLQVYLKDFNITSTPAPWLKADGYITSYTGNYQLIKIPLADLFTVKELDTKQMTRFGLLTNQLGANKPLDMWVDDIYVTGSMVADVTINASEPTCSARGKIVVASIAGQTGPFNYYINGNANPAGLTNNTFDGLNAGTYLIRITGPNGFVYMEEVKLTSAQSVLNITGVTSSGAADITVTGGSGNYTYLWSNGNTTQDISGVTDGEYTVTVIDTQTGCKATQTFQIVSAKIELTTTDAACAPNGKIKVSKVIGSSGALSYYINGMANAAGINNNEFSDLAPGTYSITVKDNNSFEKTEQAIVGGSGSAPKLVLMLNNANINLTVTGGSGNYTYKWSNGSTSKDLKNITSGTYTVDVIDSKTNCMARESITVQVVIPTIKATNAGCAPNGSIAVTDVMSGLTNVKYYINGNLNPNGETSPNFNNLVPATYAIKITADDDYIYEQNVPVGGSATAPIVNAVSKNKDIDITVTNGSGDYSYRWSTGAITEDLFNVSEGTYTVTVKDELRNCETSLTIKHTIPKPPATSLVIYPNPALYLVHEVKIKYEVPTIQDRTITIRDLLGRVIWKQKLNNTSGELTVGKGVLKTGVYIVNLSGSDGISKQLIVI